MNKIFFRIFVLLIVLVLSVQEISAECNATIWGKIGFSGYTDSAAMNAAIQIISTVNGVLTGPLNSTQTDENGFYTTNIFFNGTSKNISVKITKEDEYVKTYSILINCNNNISINYSIEKCNSAIFYVGYIKDIKDGNFTNINETDERKEVKIHLVAIPKGSKGVYDEYVNSTKTDENSSVCVLPVVIYSYWQTNLTSWAEPTKSYYYRVYDDESYNIINSSNYSSLTSCGSSIRVDIPKNFIRFPRKSVGDNCNYDDECRSNFCNNTSHACRNECNCHADCAGDQICNATNQCQNLICQPPNGAIFNHTCVNCTDDATCGEQFCNLTMHACQPIYCTINETCRSNQFCNTTITISQCQNLFCLGNQRAFNHTCINCSSYDFDNNNITDIFDAVYILEYISGEKKDISGCADVDNNGIIDLFDAAYILYYL